MKTRRNSSLVLLLVISATVVSGGCDAEFVLEAGRSSLASFVNEVLTTAVNETISPSD